MTLKDKVELYVAAFMQMPNIRGVVRYLGCNKASGHIWVSWESTRPVKGKERWTFVFDLPNLNPPISAEFVVQIARTATTAAQNKWSNR